jgi:8-amino-7-oxononanoate synthase
MSDLLTHLEKQRLQRQAQDKQRSRRLVHTPCGPLLDVEVAGSVTPHPRLAFCSNDYLGLANQTELIEALIEGARRFGVGSGASHLISGHTEAHHQLEEHVAALLAPHIPQSRALSFCTGYMANLALLSTLADAQTTVFADKLNHASLLDGALLSKGQLQRYPHHRIDALEQLLQRSEALRKLIVTDSVFSMDGDLANLPALLTLAEQHDAWLIIDDAHGFGVLGEQGQGALAHFQLHSERLIYMATLGKAVGVAGAVVVAHEAVIDHLIQTARPYIYTTATPPAVAWAALRSLQLIQSPQGHTRRQQLRNRIEQLRTGLQGLLQRHPHNLWQVPSSETAIQPLIIGSNDRAMALSQALDDQGVWVPAIRPPTVAEGTARLRISLSAAHSAADVQTLLNALDHAASI